MNIYSRDLLDLDSKQSNFSKGIEKLTSLLIILLPLSTAIHSHCWYVCIYNADAYLLFNPTIPEEFDVYGLLARTIPDPSPIKELVLTSDNFDERILKFERTAVLFHLSCKL